jgi:REP element-mobilizing transposase RayT
MDKYQNKYRIASVRAQWWDYSADGLYFITVCTAHRKCLFGTIVNVQMNISPIGQIVLQEWEKSFDIRAELFCDAFVLMPNHLHAILRIDNGGGSSVGAHGRAPLPSEQSESNKKTGVAYRVPKSISSFMAGFKSSATKYINEYRKTPTLPVWQSRFHDHIIRNEQEYERIALYIKNNPANWQEDKFNSA